MSALWMWGKVWKKGLFYLVPKYVFLTYFSKNLTKKVFKIYKPVTLYPIKWWLFKVFAWLQESPLLIENVVKGAASYLREILATESPWKMMKNAFYSFLNLFVLKIFQFLSWLFGHVEKTARLER